MIDQRDGAAGIEQAIDHARDVIADQVLAERVAAIAYAYTQVTPLTAQQRAVLAPYREAVQQAQAALQQAFTLLVVGAGVDLTTYAARLDDAGEGYVTAPIARGDT